MQLDALAIRLRPRSPLEAADLGVRLCQSIARPLYRCYAMVAIPVMGLSLATFEFAPWLAGLLIWWSKPWLDRTILHVLSRAAFGQSTTPRDVWRAQGHVWWSQLIITLTWRRLSPWRSFTQPVFQLEGLRLSALRQRLPQLRRARAGQGMLLTTVFGLAETALVFALVSLIFWFAPKGEGGGAPLSSLFAGDVGDFMSLALTAAYAMTVLFLEPFYVAAGFAMYLNRRAELEAWDIEQEFRRAFSH